MRGMFCSNSLTVLYSSLPSGLELETNVSLLSLHVTSLAWTQTGLSNWTLK